MSANLVLIFILNLNINITIKPVSYVVCWFRALLIYKTQKIAEGFHNIGKEVHVTHVGFLPRKVTDCLSLRIWDCEILIHY